MNKLSRRELVNRTALAGARVALLLEVDMPSARAVTNSGQLAKGIQELRGL